MPQLAFQLKGNGLKDNKKTASSGLPMAVGLLREALIFLLVGTAGSAQWR
jgi:hypothetical protein